MTINELKKGDKVIIHTRRNDDIGGDCKWCKIPKGRW